MEWDNYDIQNWSLRLDFHRADDRRSPAAIAEAAALRQLPTLGVRASVESPSLLASLAGDAHELDAAGDRGHRITELKVRVRDAATRAGDGERTRASP